MLVKIRLNCKRSVKFILKNKRNHFSSITLIIRKRRMIYFSVIKKTKEKKIIQKLDNFCHSVDLLKYRDDISRLSQNVNKRVGIHGENTEPVEISERIRKSISATMNF